MRITASLKAFLASHYGLTKAISDQQAERLAQACLDSGALSAEKLAELTKEHDPPGVKLLEGIVGRAVKGAMNGGQPAGVTGGQLYTMGLRGGDRAGKDIADCSEDRPILKHVKTGKEIIISGQPVRGASEMDLAKCGTWFRWHLARQGFDIGRPLDAAEKDLLFQMASDDRWAGPIGDQWSDGLTLRQLGIDSKALINDATSGGTYLVPTAFDTAVITYPLLFGELFPFVDVVETDRASVETGAVGNPAVTWNNTEGNAQSLVSTSGLVSQITATIFPVQVLIEVGRDLLSDSPAAIGAVLQANCGQSMMKELDRVIAVGDGTTQPQGLFTASGTTSVISQNAGGGPPTVADYESLMFAVGKQYRNAAFGPAFVANDTSYARARGIAVSVADERRVFGMDHQSYTLLEHPYRVQNDIANTKIAFGGLKRYRMWRRTGFEVRTTDQGQQLFQKNTLILTVRGRFGGKVVDANAFAVTTNAQS